MWHGAVISESDNSGGDRIFKNAGNENIFEVENVGRKNSEVQNHVDFNHINTDSNHANSNHADLNQLISAKLPIIEPNNDSSDFCALQEILSWGSMEAESSYFFMRTSMLHHTGHTYVSSVHTTSLVHSYPPVPTPRHTLIFTYG